jgi:hypothetical protein
LRAELTERLPDGLAAHAITFCKPHLGRQQRSNGIDVTANGI